MNCWTESAGPLSDFRLISDSFQTHHRCSVATPVEAWLVWAVCLGYALRHGLQQPSSLWPTTYKYSVQYSLIAPAGYTCMYVTYSTQLPYAPYIHTPYGVSTVQPNSSLTALEEIGLNDPRRFCLLSSDAAVAAPRPRWRTAKRKLREHGVHCPSTEILLV